MLLPGLLLWDINVPLTAFTAQVDIVEITTASTQCAWVIGYDIGQSTEIGDAQEEQLQLTWVTGHTTSGNGTTNTPAPNGHATAFAGVAEHMATTIASGGTGTVRRGPVWNVRAGSTMMWDPSKILWLPQSTRAVLRVPAPTDSVTLAATIHMMGTP